MVVDTVCTVVGVPVISPVAGLIVSPSGRPLKDQTSGATPPASTTDRETAVPVRLVRSPGLVSTGGATTVQVKVESSVRESRSVTVTFTE
jgi:hypothetical protein